MLTGNDVLVLVRLAAKFDESWTFRELASELAVDSAALHRSVGRLKQTKLLDADRKPIRTNLEEFLAHGLRYLVPAELGPLGRGIPTAWGAPPLANLVAVQDAEAPVWPDPNGDSRGPLLDPVAEGVPSLAKNDRGVGEWFALIDAVRIGRAREQRIAGEQLGKKIWDEQELRHEH